MVERPKSIPEGPGSYQFRDKDGRIIYVGKASSLRSRLSNYFADPATMHPRTAQMVAQAASVEWIQVQSDVEAIMLEYSLIKQHRPRFNIRLVDDKSYPYLAVTVDDQWPRATVMRGAKRKGTRYFGPYAHAYAIRETLDLLLRSFPIRTCSDIKFRRHERLGKPCLLFHIERCSGPCVGSVTPERYAELVEEFLEFLDGETKPVVRRLEQEMRDAADTLEYELAARYRDRLASVRLAIERQEMVTDRPEDFDAIGLVEDDLEAAAQILHVRRGRVVGRQGIILEKVEELSTPQLVERVLEQHYAESPLEMPREVLVPELPEDLGTYEAWLTELRKGRSHRGTSGRVAIRVAQRGRKRVLVATATKNASEQFTRHKMHRSTDLTSRAIALEQLQKALGLPEAPLRIECYDMSHLQGTDYVGSMVVMEDGLPKRSDYRRFKVSVGQNDDYGAMYEVLTRRLSRLAPSPGGAVPSAPDDGGRVDGGPDALEVEDLGVDGAEGEDIETSDDGELGEDFGRRRRGSRFAYPPQLILLDGGKGQLGVGEQVVEELGLRGRLSLASLAKQFEEVFVPGRQDPIRIPRDSEAIYLLQQIRDEAHRFAITFHRERRGKRMTRGALDGVPGLGPTRRKRLVEEMGGVRAVQAASLDDLLALAWLPDAVARSVYDHLHGGRVPLRRGVAET
ncbi:MAG TPA: excinuclease ABC subunit UvrC [Acidimicrobiales bacterium]|nr:excinuclease ABC subunit UvrC [Acidimicrobiales bacterium]